MPNLIFTLTLGFILGLKHAFEPDHVLAVSTIASEQKNPFKAAITGTFWGIGHTTTLLIIGIIVLYLKLSIPQNLTVILERLVGIMLIVLGIRAIKRRNLIFHDHIHPQDQSKVHKHHTSFVIGSVHGLAGSGALMLLVLSTIQSVWEGLYYILIFGLGSMVGMSMMSFFIAMPFAYSADKFPGLEKKLRVGVGVLSILFGVFILLASLSSILRK